MHPKKKALNKLTSVLPRSTLRQQLSLSDIHVILEDGKLISLSVHKKASITSDNQKVYNEIKAYLADAHYAFKTPTAPKGTAFQMKVWKALQSIPVGTVVTYGQLAKKLKTSARAIGQACRTNPIPIIIPCHRVVGANDLGGYSGKRSGKMLNFKISLLQHEIRKPL